MAQVYSERYRTFWLDAYKWRVELSLLKKIALAVGFACLTGLLAQVRLPLPWSPIPITGQTFAVLVAGVLLGRNYGGLSQAIYALFGFAGVPWFTGGTGGIAALGGPTTGYIIGFIFAALFIGYITDTFIASRSFTPMFAIMLIANFGIIHVFGLTYLYIILVGVSGMNLSFISVLWMGTIPFIIGDVFKAFLATSMAISIMPKQTYSKR